MEPQNKQELYRKMFGGNIEVNLGKVEMVNSKVYRLTLTDGDRQYLNTIEAELVGQENTPELREMITNKLSQEIMSRLRWEQVE